METADVAAVTERIVTGEMILVNEPADVMTMTETTSTKKGETEVEGQ